MREGAGALQGRWPPPYAMRARRAVKQIGSVLSTGAGPREVTLWCSTLSVCAAHVSGAAGRAVEAVGLAPPGQGGSWVETRYHQLFLAAAAPSKATDAAPAEPPGTGACTAGGGNAGSPHASASRALPVQEVLPINTHGALCSLAACLLPGKCMQPCLCCLASMVHVWQAGTGRSACSGRSCC